MRLPISVMTGRCIPLLRHRLAKHRRASPDDASVKQATIGLAIAIAASLPAAASDYPPAGNESTDAGRLVWLGTCESCHAYGIAGAPNPLKATDWSARVSKPRELLYEHAIAGFFGPEDTYMPPKGGNDELSDNEVKAAVNYMVEFALKTIQLQERQQ